MADINADVIAVGPLGSGAVSVAGSIIIAEGFVTKTQFVSGENLRITFPAFIDSTNGSRINVGADVATLVIKRPDNTLLSGPPVPSFDTDVDIWTAEVPFASFQEGEWLVLATTNDANGLDQFLALTWGDYVDDIPETRQATLGRWRIIATQLLLYEEDGTTVFKTFDLKDAAGLPTITQIFERDPV